MRILILHSRYLSGAVSGENRVVDDESKVLREAGHEVTVWDPQPMVGRGIEVALTGARAIWSSHAVSKVQDLITTSRPDIVHCHNLFPELSPAVLRTASAYAPVVMTLHNYRALCLPATFVRDGRICEDCLGREPWPGVVHACYRGSTGASTVLATSIALHRAIGSFDRASLYVAVSDFVKRKHVEAGWSEDRITVKPNFAWPSPRRDGSGTYFLYVGRLSPEKGVSTLLDAFRDGPSRLVVVGEGPEGDALRARSSPSVEFRGSLGPAEVAEVIRGARALLVPSVCYEGQPRVILEAYAAGVPVLASDIGGLPESVVHGETGFLVPNQVDRWAVAVERMADEDQAGQLGDGAWARWDRLYSPERALEGLESTYALAISKAGI